MFQAWRHPIGSIVVILALILGALPALADEVEEVSGPAAKQQASKADWLAAGLDPAEYNQAMELGVGIDQWKELDSSRKNRRTAGWACVGVGVLGGGILATVYLAQDWGLTQHPQQEAFIISLVAAGATFFTGIIVASTPPGPEDFIQQWKDEGHLADGGIHLGETTLYPGPTGLLLKF